MQYPLTLTFKVVAVAPQITVTDATGASVLYLRQKAFKLKEAVTVYRSEARETPLYTIQADRVLDFNAVYRIRDGLGNELGALARRGRRSIWKARYDVLNAEGRPAYRVQEDNAWVKVLDGILQQIPLLNLFGGLLFNPTYTVEADDPTTPEQEGDPVMTLAKQKVFFEGRFELDRIADVPAEDEVLIALALMMMTLRERARG